MEPVEPFVATESTEISGRRTPVAGYLALGGALAVVVGSFGPWVSIRLFFTELTTRGTDADGQITVALGAISLVLLLLRLVGRLGRWAAWLAVGLLGVTSLIGVVDWVDSRNHVSGLDGNNEFGVSGSVGWGLILVTLGAIVGTVAALLHAVIEVPKRKPVTAPSPVPTRPIEPELGTSLGDAATNAESDVRPSHQW